MSQINTDFYLFSPKICWVTKYKHRIIRVENLPLVLLVLINIHQEFNKKYSE